MKAAGLLLLIAGLAIVVSAIVILPADTPRSAFALAGIATQCLGLVLFFRAHYTLNEGQ